MTHRGARWMVRMIGDRGVTVDGITYMPFGTSVEQLADRPAFEVRGCCLEPARRRCIWSVTAWVGSRPWGASVVDPALASELVSARRRDDPLAALSARKREVLALMAEGRSNGGIAHRLWVTEGTVEKHVRSLDEAEPARDRR